MNLDVLSYTNYECMIHFWNNLIKCNSVNSLLTVLINAMNTLKHHDVLQLSWKTSSILDVLSYTNYECLTFLELSHFIFFGNAFMYSVKPSYMVLFSVFSI